jgi:2'-5' RNA ligase
MLRAIHIFPEFSNGQLLHELRSHYDPLVQLIAPHITLVFPFESDLIPDEIARHVHQAIDGIRPFEIRLDGITGSEGSYLFLNVKQGNDAIIELHDRLYTGPFATFLNRRLTYVPHLTVGRLDDKTTFESALVETVGFTEVFRSTVRDIGVERIDAEGASHLEMRMPLQP